MNELTTEQQINLARIEAIVKDGQKGFIEVGLALAEISRKKLYQESYDTFEDYCKNVWGWDNAYAYRLIEATDHRKNSHRKNRAVSIKPSEIPDGYVQIYTFAKKLADIISKAAIEQKVKSFKLATEDVVGPYPAFIDPLECLEFIKSNSNLFFKIETEQTKK